MANLKEVKNRIKSVNSTQQITKAMKMVAASKLRKAQDRIVQIRPYVEKLDDILKNLLAASTPSEGQDFSQKRPQQNVLIVVVSSDRGLCGGFNSTTFKTAEHLVKNEYAAEQKEGRLTMMPIGKKAFEFFKRRDYKIVEDYGFILQDLDFDIAKKAAEYAMTGFLDEKFDVVRLVYNEFKNVATQVVKTSVFLPMSFDNDKKADEESTYDSDYIYDPSETEIVESLIPKSLKITFYKALLESSASEMGARMTAMDKATENANELLKSLRLTYNRTRQAAITNEILEIVGGAEALSND